MQPPADVAVAPERAVDEVGDAFAALVRAYRHAGRRPEAGHAALSALELVRLLGEGERRLSELAELRGVGQSVVSRRIGELEARHLACRRPDPTDDGPASSASPPPVATCCRPSRPSAASGCATRSRGTRRLTCTRPPAS